MNRNQKGVVVILDDDSPLGILTERDIVEIVHRGADLDDAAGKYLKKNLVTTRGDRTIGYALNLALENNIRRVIVTDKSRKFLGIVTLQDLLKYIEEDFYRLTIKVKHIQKKEKLLVSMSPDEKVGNALRQLAENRISAIPIIDDGTPIGIITEKDILRLISERVSLETRVSRCMSSPVDIATPDTPLVEVVEVMNYKNIRRIVVVDNNGSAVGIITIRDVMENLESDYSQFLEKKLHSAKEILNLLPEMLIEVTDTEKDQLIVWANDKVINHFGADIIDSPVTRLFPKEQWKKLYKRVLKFNKIEHYKVKIDEKFFELSGFFVKIFSSSEKGRLHIIMRDITEDIKLSTIDPLTNIYNRRFVNGFMIKEVEKCKRLKKQFSIVISDVDEFKFINDNYGHLSGDMILKSLAHLITDTLRSMDVAGRYGGDEFMIILPAADSSVAASVVERLRNNIASAKFPIIKDRTVDVCVSFGIATFPEDAVSIDDLLIKADERLYKDKARRKSQV